MRFTVLAALVALLATPPCFAEEEAPPEPVFVNLEDEIVRLSDLRGEVVLFTFWATWCGACRHEMPEIARLHAELSPRGLRVVSAAVNGKNEAEQVRQAARRLGMKFDVWLWANAGDMKHYGVGPQLPATLLVDREGRVRHRWRGPADADRLRRRVASLSSSATETRKPNEEDPSEQLREASP